MRLLIGIITVLVMALIVGVIGAVSNSILSLGFIYFFAAVGYFAWLRIARTSGLVD